MTNQFSFEGSQSIENKSIYPKFCENCGFSLVNLGTFCLSRKCAECGKEVFFIRQSEDGGVQIKEGEKFHVPKLTFSLDPTTGGWFTREGLDQFIKQMFLGRKISSEQELVDIFKDIEKNIDNRLTNLDCISHCNLETEAGLKEAIEILEEKDLNGYKFDLFRSSLLRECYLAIEDGNALGAAYAAHQANLFKELSILEEPHLKEIISSRPRYEPALILRDACLKLDREGVSAHLFRRTPNSPKPTPIKSSLPSSAVASDYHHTPVSHSDYYDEQTKLPLSNLPHSHPNKP